MKIMRLVEEKTLERLEKDSLELHQLKKKSESKKEEAIGSSSAQDLEGHGLPVIPDPPRSKNYQKIPKFIPLPDAPAPWTGETETKAQTYEIGFDDVRSRVPKRGHAKARRLIEAAKQSGLGLFKTGEILYNGANVLEGDTADLIRHAVFPTKKKLGDKSQIKFNKILQTAGLGHFIADQSANLTQLPVTKEQAWYYIGK